MLQENKETKIDLEGHWNVVGGTGGHTYTSGCIEMMEVYVTTIVH